MGQVGSGPSLSWVVFVMGRGVQLPSCPGPRCFLAEMTQSLFNTIVMQIVYFGFVTKNFIGC